MNEFDIYLELVLGAITLFGIIIYIIIRKPYTVVVAQSDFTGFSGTKSFKTYKQALEFAGENVPYFDAVWIEMKDGTIKKIKGGV